MAQTKRDVEIPEKVKVFLAKPNFAVLATVTPKGKPHATPMWFMLENGYLLMNTSKGRLKLRNIQADRRVAVSVLDRENPYRYVQIQGRVERIDEAAGARDIDRLSMRYRGERYAYPPSDRPEWRVTLLIRPEHISTNIR